eukprot:CAMPEP_0170170574 /NCGR_PEP_ID=MMETSP0040_2-20121228/3569_1 /TAXON_ID=641309 /ORGANISM="Lotharella oceanica, Strain CCMP622" /LENGTH=72 /DNA_ID=CAMNT_0010410063 /DNA_START=654 /DNA_END=872 /DNA_ORIENTATION=+
MMPFVTSSGMGYVHSTMHSNAVGRIGKKKKPMKPKMIPRPIPLFGRSPKHNAATAPNATIANPLKKVIYRCV